MSRPDKRNDGHAGSDHGDRQHEPFIRVGQNALEDRPRDVGLLPPGKIERLRTLSYDGLESGRANRSTWRRSSERAAPRDRPFDRDIGIS